DLRDAGIALPPDGIGWCVAAHTERGLPGPHHDHERTWRSALRKTRHWSGALPAFLRDAGVALPPDGIGWCVAAHTERGPPGPHHDHERTWRSALRKTRHWSGALPAC